MSLLTICQRAARKLSIGVPTAIASSTSQDAMLLWELANEEGFFLARRANWVGLRREHVFTSTAADEQVGSVPEDFSFMLDETFNDRTARLPIEGPMAAQEWQEWKMGVLVQSETWWSQRGDVLMIAPNPPAGHTMAYEYISTHWARSASGVPQYEFQADSDTHVWGFDDIIKLGVIWRWRKHKGLPFEDERIDYERAVTDAIMRNGGKRRLHMSDRNTRA